MIPCGRFVLLFLVTLVLPLSLFAQSSNQFSAEPAQVSPLDIPEASGQFGNSEVKHYSGNLGLFLQLPTYKLNGANEGVTLTYRSQTADPWLSFQSEHVFLHTFDELEIVSNTNHHPALVQKFSGLESIDPKHEGYFFKTHFPADKLSTGFYDGQFLLKYRYFESSGPFWLSGVFKTLSRLPYFGKFFGSIKQPVEQKIKNTFVLNSASAFYGAGWHLSANRRLVWGKNKLARILGDGSFYLYQSTDDKSFSSEGINQGSLVRTSHGFLFTDIDGAKEHYNQQGELTLREDAQKRRTEYWRFSWGGLWKVIDNLGQETVFSYNQQRKLQFIIDARGRKTFIVINKNGDLVGATFPDGSQLAFTYDKKHHPIETTSPRGFKTTYRFDEYGKIKSITDAVGAITSYDTAFADGSLNELSKLYSKTESPLMSIGSLFSHFTSAMGHTTKYQFKQIPLVWKTTNPLGRTTTENRDAKGQVTETIQPNGNIISYKYDFLGNREEIYNHGSDTKTKLIYGFGKIMEIKDSRATKPPSTMMMTPVICWRLPTPRENKQNLLTTKNISSSAEQTPTGRPHNLSMMIRANSEK